TSSNLDRPPLGLARHPDTAWELHRLQSDVDRRPRLLSFRSQRAGQPLRLRSPNGTRVLLPRKPWLRSEVRLGRAGSDRLRAVRLAPSLRPALRPGAAGEGYREGRV